MSLVHSAASVDAADLYLVPNIVAKYPNTLTRRSVRTLYETGRISRYRLGGRILVSEREILALLASGRSQAVSR